MDLLHTDDRLAVVNKPSGLLVHQGWARAPEVAVTLARRLVGKFVYPVHRLDRGASGVLVFALDAETARELHEMFEDGRVEKRYLAIVRGVPPAQGRIDHPIPRREDGPRVPATTDFRLVGSGALDAHRYSLVEARPLTGRLHQVRRHLKHIDHPIIGDANYGKGDHNRRFRDRLGVNRLCLHASGIKIGALEVTAPLPPELASAVTALGIAGM